MKNLEIKLALSSLAIIIILVPLFLNAQGIESVTLLEPVPGSDGTASGTDFSYFSTIYNFALGVAIALAVLMIVIGGVKYSASGINPSLRSDAKTQIWSAIGGLILALVSFVLLRTINPELVAFTLPTGGAVTIDDGSGDGGSDGDNGSTGSNQFPGGAGANCGNCGSTDEVDITGRDKLRASGVDGFDLDACSTGTRPCGEYTVINNGILRENQYIDDNCSKCTLIARDVNGPGHSGSGHPSGGKVDYAPEKNLNNYVRDNFKRISNHGSWERWESPTGAIWMFEKYSRSGKNHWDVDIRKRSDFDPNDK